MPFLIQDKTSINRKIMFASEILLDEPSDSEIPRCSLFSTCQNLACKYLVYIPTAHSMMERHQDDSHEQIPRSQVQTMD